jgi:hypothetical protein
MPSKRIYVFLEVSSGYFPKQHKPDDRFGGGGLFGFSYTDERALPGDLRIRKFISKFKCSPSLYM